MRAKMSTWAEHAEDGSRYVCGFNVAMAEAEARAILAETELFVAVQTTAGPMLASAGYYSPAWRRADCREQREAFGSLAEALAVFVAE